MTPIASALAIIGWGPTELARRIGVTESWVRCWVVGRNARGNPASPPADVIDRLARIAAVVEREFPAPGETD